MGKYGRISINLPWVGSEEDPQNTHEILIYEVKPNHTQHPWLE